MKKALVYYLYGNRNSGDMAICMGTIEFLLRHGYKVTMVSRFSEAEDEYRRSRDYVGEYYPDVTVCPGPFSFERAFSVLKKLSAYTRSMLKVIGLEADRVTHRLITDHDIVFFNGGNLLRGSKTVDYLRLVALFYPIQIAHKMGKEVYCLPQSTAEISNFGEKLLKKYLSGFEKIFVREKISYDELTRRFPVHNFIASTDMAFLCQDTEIAKRKFAELNLRLTGKDIAIVVRNTGIGDIGELSLEKQERLKAEVQTFVQAHESYHYWIVVQTEKDRAFSKILQDSVKMKAELIECHDPLLLREIYKHMEALVTMRLHAGILSLSAHTPVIGVFTREWGLKNPGIMKDYNMPFVLIEDCDCGKIKDLLKKKTDDIKGTIAENIMRQTQTIDNI